MLTLTNVRKRYGTLIAVDGLSLEIRRGEIFGLLGQTRGKEHDRELGGRAPEP